MKAGTLRPGSKRDHKVRFASAGHPLQPYQTNPIKTGCYIPKNVERPAPAGCREDSGIALEPDQLRSLRVVSFDADNVPNIMRPLV
ncbi:Evolved beta-galactosidase subunit alpha [Frankliniella fusca]|uniref:Evolved beta-galactosidase subunit alpha n=1 Tax=Frankliniella fusca TaxID=407009 RepID=A0AAE1I0X1_9NEOP|nr:Evolved beta-galactosidase subunit alpha [Frankliniella fusca]